MRRNTHLPSLIASLQKYKPNKEKHSANNEEGAKKPNPKTGISTLPMDPGGFLDIGKVLITTKTSGWVLQNTVMIEFQANSFLNFKVFVRAFPRVWSAGGPRTIYSLCPYLPAFSSRFV